MILNYLRIAVKVLRRRLFFTFISLFAISFTLMVLMVATAVLDNMFAPEPPETKQDRTLTITRVKMSGKENVQISNPGYKFLANYMRPLTGAAMTSIWSSQAEVSCYKEGTDIKPFLKRTDGAFWQILEFTFLEGRPISDEDERQAQFVAVINLATKEKLFGNGPATGRYLVAGGQSFRVIGVVANVPSYRQVPFSDIWVPLSTTPDPDYKDALLSGCGGLILARDASDFPAIKEEFHARIQKVEFPSSDYTTIECEPGSPFDDMARELLGYLNGHERAMFIAVLLIVAFLFMLLPTINLININISRIIERSSEIGVRKSFGASAGNLVLQFLAENVFLTLIGGLLGFLASFLVLAMLTRSGLIPYAEFHLNLRIFCYSFLTILFFGVLSGIYPAWKMARLQPVNALKGIVR